MSKKMKLLLTVLGVLLAFIILFLGIYSMEYFSKAVWESGKVIIGERIITLPCTVENFERTLNPEIIFDKDDKNIKRVKVGSVTFSIQVENDMVTGIILSAKKDDELDIDDNDRDIADDVIFPGNININSTLRKMKNTYNSAPLNIFKDSCPVNLPGGEVHSCDKYSNLDWKIEVYSVDSIITNISYYYIGK